MSKIRKISIGADYKNEARHCLKDEIEEALYAKARKVNENINDINIYDETIF